MFLGPKRARPDARLTANSLNARRCRGRRRSAAVRLLARWSRPSTREVTARFPGSRTVRRRRLDRMHSATQRARSIRAHGHVGRAASRGARFGGGPEPRTSSIRRMRRGRFPLGHYPTQPCTASPRGGNSARRRNDRPAGPDLAAAGALLGIARRDVNAYEAAPRGRCSGSPVAAEHGSCVGSARDRRSARRRTICDAGCLSPATDRASLRELDICRGYITATRSGCVHERESG